MTKQPSPGSPGLCIGPGTLRVTAALLGAAALGAIVTQLPHITRYLKIKSM